jgi:tetratricopeptide (TPR) repeat protein
MQRRLSNNTETQRIMRIPRTVAVAATAAAVLAAPPARADPVPRPEPVAGSVVAVKVGEEINLVDTRDWRSAELRQNVLPGDVLRTNALGQLALLFADRTQIRLGRNTTLVVKEIGGDNARFGLETGAIWARAARGGTGVTIDTPAAAAAVRGTDWSLSVGADGTTTLIVLEGQVELGNALGSVLVNQGEAATARIGEKPQKTVIVDIDERAQMLYRLDLGDSFTYLVPTTMPSRQIIATHARLAAIAPERRTDEEQVTFAEVAFSIDGAIATRAAVAEARRRPLGPALAARVTMVEAMIAGTDEDYALAAELFARAMPGLDPERRAVAAYGRYFSRALADPTVADPLPRSSGVGPYAVLGDAYTDGFLEGPAVAARRIQEAEKRWPDEALLPAVRAQFALIAGDRAQMEEAIGRAVGLDPDNPVALLARAYYRDAMTSELDGAIADLRRAAELQLGSSEIWNMIGNVESEREAVRESRAAYERSLALEPNNSVAMANLAVLYLDAGLVDKARPLAERAVELDPSMSFALLARGRVRLQSGDVDGAIEDFLKATTTDPAYSAALLLLSAAYMQKGETELGTQALDNAVRIDPDDPIGPLVGAVFAIDDYRADDGIRLARESLRLRRKMGGTFSHFAASRGSGSTLNDAHRFLGLDQWGRFYGDIAFDAFAGASYFDRALAGASNPLVNTRSYVDLGPDPVLTDRSFSANLQGLLLQPSGASSPNLRTTVLPTPFLEAQAGVTGVAGDEEGFGGIVGLQGYAASPFPFSMSLDGQWVEAEPSDDTVERRIASGTLVFGGQPSLTDRFAFIGTVQDTATPVPGSEFDITATEPLEDFIGYGAGGWSHTLGERNVLNVAVAGGRTTSEFDGDILVPSGLFDLRSTNERNLYFGAANHMIGIGDAVLRYGVEGGFIDGSDSTMLDGVPVADDDVSISVARAYADVRWDVTETVSVEGALFGTTVDGDVEDEGFRLEPRIGAAWSVFDGHWLRAAAMRDTRVPGIALLAPTDVLGLEPMVAPLDTLGQVDTVALRWDAEWSERLFTALEYNHQRMDDVSVEVPASLLSVDVDKATVDRIAFTANYWVGHGIGTFATVAWSQSDASGDDLDAGSSLPFLPDWYARAGFTYVHPSRLRATVQATYVGERDGTIGAGVEPVELDDFVTLDAVANWETPDRRFVLNLGVYNILDEDFDVAPGTPGWGRTFAGTAAVRF